MAGPSIAVRVIGDLTGLAKSMGDTAAHGESAASRLRSGFTGAISAFNQTGVLGPMGDALNGVNDAIGHVIDHAHGIGPAFTGAGAAIAGVGVGVSALGSKDQAAHQQLQQAVEATGKSYDDYADQVDKAVKHQEKFGDSSAETQDALRILTQATGDPAKALQLLGETTDLAAAKHISLDDAATKLGKTYNGNTKLLKEYGINVDSAKKAHDALTAATKSAESAANAHMTAVQKLNDLHQLYAGKTHLTTQEQIALRDAQDKVTSTGQALTDAQGKVADAQTEVANASGKGGDAIALLADKIKGQGSAQADTFTGKLKGLKAAVEDNVAQFGQKYGPALTGAGTAMAGFGSAMTIAKGATEALKNSQILQSAITKTATAVQWLFNAAMDANPIMLVVIGLGLLVAGFVLAYQHVSWFRAIVQDVFDWIKEHWPLLLAILLGPIGIAIDLIIKNWGKISDAVSWVWNTVLYPIFNGFVWFFNLMGNVVKWVWENVIKPAWDALSGAWSWLWNNVLKPGFDGIRQMWGDIGNAIKWVWDNIIKPAWDALRDAASWLFDHVIKPGIDSTKTMWNDLGNAIKWVWENVIKPPLDLFKKAVDDITGAVSSVGGALSHIPGAGLISHIPGLQHGGIVTRPTLALVGEAGPEAVIPLNRVRSAPAGGGPVVNIENATFAQQMDVDLFMQRVAWHAQVAKV